MYFDQHRPPAKFRSQLNKTLNSNNWPTTGNYIYLIYVTVCRIFAIILISDDGHTFFFLVKLIKVKSTALKNRRNGNFLPLVEGFYPREFFVLCSRTSVPRDPKGVRIFSSFWTDAFVMLGIYHLQYSDLKPTRQKTKKQKDLKKKRCSLSSHVSFSSAFKSVILLSYAAKKKKKKKRKQ